MNLRSGKLYKRKMELAKGVHLVTYVQIQGKTDNGYLGISIPANSPVLIEENCKDIFEEVEECYPEKKL